MTLDEFKYRLENSSASTEAKREAVRLYFDDMTTESTHWPQLDDEQKRVVFEDFSREMEGVYNPPPGVGGQFVEGLRGGVGDVADMVGTLTGLVPVVGETSKEGWRGIAEAVRGEQHDPTSLLQTIAKTAGEWTPMLPVYGATFAAAAPIKGVVAGSKAIQAASPFIRKAVPALAAEATAFAGIGALQGGKEGVEGALKGAASGAVAAVPFVFSRLPASVLARMASMGTTGVGLSAAGGGSRDEIIAGGVLMGILGGLSPQLREQVLKSKLSTKEALKKAGVTEEAQKALMQGALITPPPEGSVKAPRKPVETEIIETPTGQKVVPVDAFNRGIKDTQTAIVKEAQQQGISEEEYLHKIWKAPPTIKTTETTKPIISEPKVRAAEPAIKPVVDELAQAHSYFRKWFPYVNEKDISDGLVRSYWEKSQGGKLSPEEATLKGKTAIDIGDRRSNVSQREEVNKVANVTMAKTVGVDYRLGEVKWEDKPMKSGEWLKKSASRIDKLKQFINCLGTA